ncbi:MAG: hypothetical protein PVH41_19120 [Anaerolineae bacterium]
MAGVWGLVRRSPIGVGSTPDGIRRVLTLEDVSHGLEERLAMPCQVGGGGVTRICPS